jgi:hypothetical protein
MAQQRHIESGIARRIGFQRARRQRRDLPAGAGGARGRARHRAQQHDRDARAFGRERKAPARGQIEQTRLAPGFDQHGAQRRAACRLGPGPQHALRIPHPHQQDARGIEAELRQARRVQAASLGIEDILPDPEDRALLRRPDRDADGKASRCREVRGSRRVDLMQSRARDATAQRFVESGCAKGHLPHDGRRRQPRGLREVAAEFGQDRAGGVHACQRKLFSICSI